ncbi:MAG: redoxin domain-containing protein [Planctomycetales bacterium]|nr:redoxin domain-containing protein [Planctomycetales bacterium]
MNQNLASDLAEFYGYDFSYLCGSEDEGISPMKPTNYQLRLQRMVRNSTDALADVGTWLPRSGDSIKAIRWSADCRLILCICFALTFCLFNRVSVAGGPLTWPPKKMLGTDGEPVLVEPGKFTVLCFLGTECPLARLYGPRLQSLADQYTDKGVAFLGVNSNLQDSPAEIDAYAKEHSVTFPIVKDSDQSIADLLGATRTPEVFIVDSTGLIRYQGRIDDQYEPGVARASPTQNDLRDAIDAVLSGHPVAQPKTNGVGCLITRITRPKSGQPESQSVTFTRDIAPILNRRCVECHRSGEIGPMELSEYDEVVGWGQMILEVIDQKRMPPWHADPAVGHFVGQRSMPTEERNAIESWLQQGMPQGDPADLPPLPPHNDGWQFPTQPDFEFAMRDRPFMVPADGVVEYQYYVVDPKWTEDHWIRGAQVVPGDPSVVHHAIVFVRPPDDSGFDGIGWMGAYVPGQRAVTLPPGHARLVPAGSKLVFQMHYTPNGRITPDTSRVGVWEIPARDVSHEVFTQLAINHQFEIPPGSKDHVVSMSVDRFPPNSRMLGITPHMHLRGKAFQLDARLRDGSSNPLLRVPHYDFNWQHWYQFREPIELGSLDSLQMSVTFDNSTANPFNPAPEDYVSWGDQTWEEMAVAFFDVAIPRGGAKRKPDRPEEWTGEQIAVMEKKIERLADEFFARMDLNKDGIVTRDETSVTFRRHGFNRMDRNYDGKIERDEVVAEAGERL